VLVGLRPTVHDLGPDPSLAASPRALIETPNEPATGPSQHVLSAVLRSVRLSGSVQFCFAPRGAWQTDDKPALAALAPGRAGALPFHIVVEGQCWLRAKGREITLGPGDVVAFPFDDGHQLGAGSGGRTILPIADLPPRPWSRLPVLRYGQDAAEGAPAVELLCGYLLCDALGFGPLRRALPDLLLVRGSEAGPWLRATIAQIAAEARAPRAGGVAVLERLSEVTFIELLRHRILTAGPGATGWLAALAEPRLARCLALIHDDPARDWTVAALAAASGQSRSALTARFATALGTSPMRYLRDWRLHLARVALSTGRRPIAAVALDAGYGAEAAFCRAFARSFGLPPAAWRQAAQGGA